jgi:hypothetical protein
MPRCSTIDWADEVPSDDESVKSLPAVVVKNEPVAILKKKKVREGSYWVFNTFSDVYIKHVFGDYLTYQNKQGKTVYAKWGSAESHAVYNKDNVVLDMMTGLKYVFRNMTEKNRLMYDFDCKATLVYNKEA